MERQNGRFIVENKKEENMKLFTLLALTSMVLLAACGPTPPETNETDEAAAGEEITLYVGPKLAECTGEGPQACMMVKENLAGLYYGAWAALLPAAAISVITVGINLIVDWLGAQTGKQISHEMLK